MALFSWQYDFTGAARTWAVSGMFCLVGLLCGVILPYTLMPKASPGSLPTDGTVVRIEVDDGMQRPVFQFTDRNGSVHEIISGIASNHSAYRVGNRVTVVFDPADPAGAFVQDDKDLAVVLWILRALALIFGSFGLALLAMKQRGMGDDAIARAGGYIGAMVYGVAASLVLPGLWLAYSVRPNAWFAADALFGSTEWLIGLVFSATGLITLGVTWVIHRNVARLHRNQ